MDHGKFLQRCLQLANFARGRTYPNPLVGAVVVHEGKIIGEGFHHRAGEPHAEVMAIRSVRQPELLPFSTLYCSLEPCAHYGRTPPCSLLITDMHIPHVVIGCVDTNPQVAGKGIAHLEKHGVRVELAADPRPFQALNEVFFTNQNLGRPLFTLKWAQSADGIIDRVRGEQESPASISGPLAASNTHRLRAIHDGILISAKTARMDRSRLNLRHFEGPTPRPILLVGPEDHLDADYLQGLDRPPILIGHTEAYDADFETLSCDPKQANAWVPELLKRGVHAVLVEGGSQVHRWFIEQGLDDRYEVYQSPEALGAGVRAADVPAGRLLDKIDLGTDVYGRG